MSADAFVARQAILDRDRKVFGYELLFRSGKDNFFACSDGDQASSRTISNTLHVIGLSELTATRKAFVNITRKLLVEDTYAVLPREEAVIELLENVDPDAEVVAACKRLKRDGYVLALDDFVFRPGYEPLLEMADILKVDFMGSPREQRADYARRYGGRNMLLLAEKVETQADFQEAVSLGYSYFQGYFFCKPEILSGKDIPAFKQNYLRFLAQVNQPQIDFDTLEAIVKQEASLSVKLLRYLNSASFGLRSRVTSIRQALTLLGEKQIQKWASVVALASLAEDKPQELAVLCVMRGRFCEMVGPEAGVQNRDLDLFMMGLLSGLDALVDRSLTEVLAQTPVAHDVTAALLGSNTLLGKIYALALACERGLWSRVSSLASQMKIAEERVAELHQQSLRWTDQLVNT